MKISIFGTGYVGLVSGICLAEIGHDVICVDIDLNIIKLLKNGKSPIYEDGLEKLLQENIEKKKIKFTDNAIKSIQDTDIILIAVGTPEGKNGRANLNYVFNVAELIGKNINDYKVIVNKSTVPIGTGDEVEKIILKNMMQKQTHYEFDVVSNPEFLKEGKAVNDFMNPDRVVIGTKSEKAISIMKEVYKPLINSQNKFLVMDRKSSEMTKYASNSMLATKISFINEISMICEKVGANINDVKVGIGSDTRIGNQFINPGIGYGGSCFPKDIKALEKISLDYNLTPSLIQAVQRVNIEQKNNFLKRVIGQVDKSKIISILGLSFKPDTDDVREAPSFYITNELLDLGYNIKVHDPVAIKNFQSGLDNKNINNISYFDDKYDAVSEADALLILTEWSEYKQINLNRLSKSMSQKLIFDGRNIFDKKKLENLGFTYFQVGV